MLEIKNVQIVKAAGFVLLAPILISQKIYLTFDSE